MTRRHSSNDEQQNFTKLDNDYVRNTDKAINRKQQARKRKLRRIVFFAIVPVIIIALLLNVLSNQQETLAIKEKSKEEAKQHLSELKEEQDSLNLKIKQLQDDEYIAKLLRKEYYLSEKGEVIFIIPDKEDKKDD
ncbi:septum formation initiator family protein [Lysinibacillus fusiformis]|jgi:cell division protein DivIC|uniref:Cell division protein DivIC n=1 Tax=Lysinibacillus fusiformis TaxID=28031 RepID=A0A1H9S2I1_9BACI|nr:MULTISPECIES: septum formation initiator family protein [Lysinibacillus]EAZ84085.1 cell division protein DivIC, putative [Bacillus sp. B14905]MDC6270559.1 septum formation initiator family protein [Lysinibacillus sphaericus]HAU35002.1 septum formation initiator family protein [Lysinibacillus sp.]AJK89860.1 cell division protein DIVIC [Lysinibacillus fusiformis]KAB0440883.1 cell division protein DIVIC [Lysinibacillus fusiformis]